MYSSAVHVAPFRGFALVAMFIALSSCTFIASLDFSIANVAIPIIAGDFGVTVHEGTWIITLFAIGNTVTLAISGTIVKRFGATKTILWFTLLFTLSSLLCGLAWSFPSLIFFRIVQGMCSGPLISLPHSLLIKYSPPERRALIFGCYMMLWILSPVLGPVLGGIITEGYGWPWIFFINVPIGALAVMLIVILFKGKHESEVKIPFDFVGIVLLTIAVGALQLVLDRGNDQDWFSSTEIVNLSIISFISAIIFFIWNFYRDEHLMDFHFLKNRDFRYGTIVTSLAFLALTGSTILIPLWVQTQKAYTPYWAGMTLMPIGIPPIFLAPLIGYFADYLNMRFLAAIGLYLFALGFFQLAELTEQATLYDLIRPRFVHGVGLALFSITLMRISMQNIAEENLASANSLYNFFRIFIGGGGMSTAIYVTFWQRFAAKYHTDLTEVMNPLHTETVEAYKKLAAVGIQGEGTAEIFEMLLTNQAFCLGFIDLMWLSGWLMILLMPFVLFCREPSGFQDSFPME